jgi:hypothetical protein
VVTNDELNGALGWLGGRLNLSPADHQLAAARFKDSMLSDVAYQNYRSVAGALPDATPAQATAAADRHRPVLKRLDGVINVAAGQLSNGKWGIILQTDREPTQVWAPRVASGVEIEVQKIITGVAGG